MKKAIGILIVSALLIMMCVPFTVSAAQTYNIPKAASVPAIDGVINDDEWANALVVEMKAGGDGLTVPIGAAADFAGATFKFMWADDGIYFAVISNGNNNPYSVPSAGEGAYNAGNGVQFNIYPTRETPGGGIGEAFFFSYHPQTDDGKPYVGEHFTYSEGTGANCPDAKIAVVMNGNDYTMEGLIPATGLKKSEVPVNVVSGARLFWNNVIMFTDNAEDQGLASDAGWFDGDAANEYILVETLAGIVPAQAEAPAEAEPEPAPAAPPAEAAPVPAAPVAAPQTGDGLIFIIPGLIVFVCLAGSALKIGRRQKEYL